MEEHLNPLAITHLLQHTLRSLCIHENSQWVYAVFWRILPRNYPPPKWDTQGAYDRSRGNRRNWILVWEDGFCNFSASAADQMNGGDCPSSSVYANCEFQPYQGLQPELFFKMSHEIYNYGEGLIGKVAADHSHKWIYKEPNDQEINFLSSWHNSADSHPRTWEAQFQSGIKTIALIAVREGVVQLGGVHKVIEDLSYVVVLRKKFSYIESIPGVLLPHPSSSAFPYKVDLDHHGYAAPPDTWHYHQAAATIAPPPPSDHQYYHDHHINHQLPFKITPSMSSLEALLSKLPSVVPPPPPPPQQAGNSGYCNNSDQPQYVSELMGMEKITKEEIEEEDYSRTHHEHDRIGESSSSMSAYRRQQFHQHHGHDLNVTSNNGYFE